MNTSADLKVLHKTRRLSLAVSALIDLYNLERYMKYSENNISSLFREGEKFNYFDLLCFTEEDIFTGQYEFEVISHKKNWEIYTFKWLERELGFKKEEVWQLIQKIRKGEKLYHQIEIKKRNGEKRYLNVPSDELKLVQKRLSRFFLQYFIESKSSFGFCGGSIIEAIQPHLASKSILSVDFVDAFPSVHLEDVINLFGHRSREKCRNGTATYSWTLSQILTDLTLFDHCLPQGAPTSPILFDLVCRTLDENLEYLAKNVGGIYTRFADNVYFSFPKEVFPAPIRNAILKIIEARRGGNPSFRWHKLRTRKMKNNVIPMLGLNVINGDIQVRRSFKRKLRGSIYHVNWLVDNKMDFSKAWAILKGQFSFAQNHNLSEKLQDDYYLLEEKVDIALAYLPR